MFDFDKGRFANLETILISQWMGRSFPPEGLLEQRVLELESMGLVDTQEFGEMPSNLRQYAIASLQHTKPAYFVTGDDEMLMRREALESRFSLMILSVYEAMLLLREGNEPPN